MVVDNIQDSSISTLPKSKPERSFHQLCGLHNHPSATTARILHLLSDIALPVLRVIWNLLRFSFNNRTELQPMVLVMDEIPNLIILWLSSECNFAHEQFSV